MWDYEELDGQQGNKAVVTIQRTEGMKASLTVNKNGLIV
jgi:hypothetical protein